jgi:hypothetical protein
MVYKITFRDSSGYYTVTKKFADTEELGIYIENEMAYYGSKEIGTEEFKSMQDMLEQKYKKSLEKRYEGKN